MNKRQKLVQQQFLNDEKAVIKRLEQVYGKSLIDINALILQKDNEILGIKGVLTELDDLEAKIGKNSSFAGVRIASGRIIKDPKYKRQYTVDELREIYKSQLQSKIYQKQYQEQLQKQVSGIYDKLLTSGFVNVSDYLDECYTNGFIGTIFDAHGQGVPILAPIDQKAMVRAVQLESKISKGLYTRLGEDVDLLKKKITAQVSRSIATGMTYAQTAQALAGYTRIGMNNAIRIARTEGHRIQTTATMDAMEVAKKKGADVVKQWDSTLDKRTRDSHAKVDGEIREIDEPFSNGLMFPGDPDGEAAEVINCRCALLQRARWALKETMNPDTGELVYEEDTFTKFDGESNELKEFKGLNDYNSFKKKYLEVTQAPKPTPVVTTPKAVDLPTLRSELKALNSDISSLESRLRLAKRQLYYSNDKDAINQKIDDLQQQLDAQKAQLNAKGKQLVENLNTTFTVPSDNEKFVSLVVDLDSRIEYREVMKLASDRTFDGIIGALAGGDNTSGSCASVGLSYIGQKNGWDVLDFRDGKSRDWFSEKSTKLKMWDTLGVKYITEDSAKSNLTNGKRILKQMEKGKEYYLSVGRHAAVVRQNDDGVLQYLELQSANRSGWTDFGKDIGETLRYRFGCTSSSAYYSTAYLTDIDAVKDSAEFRTILGYINTSDSMQRKGASGTIK